MTWRDDGPGAQTIEAIRDQLERVHAQASRQNKDMFHDNLDAERARGDTLDESSAEQRASIRLRIGDHHSATLHQINRALERIERGTYGICRLCEEWIHPRRLQAYPVAELCLDCKEEEERHQRRSHQRVSVFDD